MLEELPGLGWRVTEPGLVRRWLADPSLSAASPRALLAGVGLDGTRFGRDMLSWFLYQDDPEHQRRRRTVQAAFTARAMAEVEASVRATAEQLVGALPRQEQVDLATELCEPLAGTTIGRLLGTDPAHEPRLAAGARRIMSAIGSPSPGAFAEAEEAMDDLAVVVEATVATEGDGLLRELHARGALDVEKLRSLATLLLFAGQGTSRDLMANVLARALADRDLWSELAADPTVAAGAVEESLRLEPAVAIAARVATTDLDVDGSAVRAGDALWFDLAAAGRHLAVDEPDAFDAHRSTTGTVAFGHGPHHCLGASLARTEAQTLLSVAASARPGLVLDAELDDLPWLPNFVYRGRAAVPAIDLA